MTQANAEQRYGLELEVLEEDRLSCRLTRIRHRGSALPDFDALRAKADRLLETVTYLEDKLRLVEQEPEAILLRSETPRRSAEGVDYYEVRLEAEGLTELSCKHYERSETETTPQDVVFTHRQLERLGQDLQAISSSLL